MRNRLLLTVLLALSSLGLAAPAQAQSRAVAKWHASHPLWMLRPDIVCSSTATTCSGGGGGVSTSGTNTWTGTQNFVDTSFFVVDDGDQTKKIAFQVSGISTGTTRTFTFPNATDTVAVLNAAQTWGGAVQAIANIRSGTSNSDTMGKVEWNTTQTPDTNMLLTGTTGNTWVIAEAQDNTFDFAHAAATDPTLFIHSHNQNTTQWIGLYHDGTNAKIDAGTGGLAFGPTSGNNYVHLTTAGIIQVRSGGQIGFSSSGTNASTANDVAFRRLAAGVMTQIGATATSIGSLQGGGTTVASADPLPVPTGIVFHVSGTTNFTNITTTNMVTGACFTMIFDGILTITDGGNLKLTGNYTTSADDTLTVCYDGTNYFEVARSVN